MPQNAEQKPRNKIKYLKGFKVEKAVFSRKKVRISPNVK
jgi:hypothetical protein